MYRRNRAPRSAAGSHCLPPGALSTLGLAVLLAACGDSTGPGARRVALTAAAGSGQFALPGQTALDSLAVMVVDDANDRAVANVTVRWRVVAGSGATVSPSTSTTDGLGVARTAVRVGPAPGEFRIEADADGRTGPAATFTIRAVAAPEIQTVAPAAIQAGATVTVTGRNFAARLDDNTVLFGGRRGRVLDASPTQLVVESPSCLPGRDYEVIVRLGAVASNGAALAVSGGTPAPLRLERGQVRILDDSAELSCLTLPGDAGKRHLVVALNAARTRGLPALYDIVALEGAPIATVTNRTVTPETAIDWEMRLRMRERALRGEGPGDGLLATQAADVAFQTSIGERRQFNVLNRDNRVDRITAEVRAVGERSIIYVDTQAPASGFTQDDIDRFARMFDDPIWPSDVAAFGTPTDVDGNGRIIILFTPAVNRLTRAGEPSFIAGFFYGCDLLEASRCSDTNRAEIFYAMVPDPQGQFGDRRSRDLVLRTVPGVLAHEFQHMINFGRKGRLDALWLSEGLAHAAEEIVGLVFASRGDPIAADFRVPNHVRARAYLASTGSTSLVSEEPPGALELRGGAWLLVRYLMEHYGDDILARLTGASAIGAANIELQTGTDWPTLLSEFALALWTTGAPELAGVALQPRHTFGSYPLRSSIASSIFPLSPWVLPSGEAHLQGWLYPASQDYFEVRAPDAGGPDYTFSFTGRWGAAFDGTPRLAVLRIR